MLSLQRSLAMMTAGGRGGGRGCTCVVCGVLGGGGEGGGAVACDSCEGIIKLPSYQAGKCCTFRAFIDVLGGAPRIDRVPSGCC